jgi:hypothetical protein
VDVTTASAPISLSYVWADPVFFPYQPTVRLATSSGDILSDHTASAGMVATSQSGTIRSSTYVGYCKYTGWPVFQFDGYVCGDLQLLARGRGRVVIVGAHTAYSAEIRAEAGELVLANTLQIIGDAITLDSSGPVYISNLIQVRSVPNTFAS